MTEKEVVFPTLSCPILQTCEERIHENEFRSICYTTKWIYCKKAADEAEKYLHKPREWVTMKMPNAWLQGKEPRKEERKTKEKKRRFFR